MIKKIFKWTIFSIFSVVMALLQSAFFNQFSPGMAIFFLASIIVFLIFINKPTEALVFALISGFTADMLSSGLFGIYMIVFLMFWSAEYLISLELLTNKSYFSIIALGLFGVLIFNIFWLVAAGSAYLININDFFVEKNYFFLILRQFLSSLIILSIMYYFAKKYFNQFGSSHI